MSEIGYTKGDVCGRHGCIGDIKCRPVENCSCHICPPCSACTAPRHYCPECGWEESEDHHINGFIGYKVNTSPVTRYVRRPLDPTKIDYHVKAHTHFTQICEGVYPEGTTVEEVLKKVKGTFGGRFEYFGNGKFKYIAYTD